MSIERIMKLLLLIMLVLFFVGCGKREKVESKNIIKIGSKVYTEKDYHDFNKTKFIYPVIKKDSFFPAKRNDPSIFVETIAMYDEAKKHLRKFSDDPEYLWREIFFEGLLYQKSVLNLNMGFTLKELKEHYNKKEKEQPGYFREPSFEIARPKVAEELFLKTFSPDSSYKAYFAKTDSVAVKGIWLNDVKSDMVTFFKKEYYKELYRKKYPDNKENIVGPKGIVTENDIDLVINWLPPKSRAKRDDEHYRLQIANKMIAFKIFYEVSKTKKWDTHNEYTSMMGWYKKYNTVHYYLNEILPKSIDSEASIDSVTVLYQFWDTNGNSDKGLEEKGFKFYSDSLSKESVNAEICKRIHKNRKQKDIKFLTKTIFDEIDRGSKQLLVKVDSLISDNQIKMTRRTVKNLTKYFNYTDEGKIVWKHLADAYYELNMYKKAIESYRSYLLTSPSKTKQIEIYSLIGYMYDQLGNYDLAEKNYLWVLKNAKGTREAEDAAFAIQHLGEPLLEPESYAVETQRQGL